MSKPAPSPAERCATCGHGANDHHFSSRDDQYWCDKCSGNAWMHPFDYTPPPATRGIGHGSVSEAQPPAGKPVAAAALRSLRGEK